MLSLARVRPPRRDGRPTGAGRRHAAMPELLTIGDVSRRSGVASSALRFYEARGLIASQRAGSGHRRYPRAVLRRVAFIVFAQRVGLTLDEIGAELARLPPDRAPDEARLVAPVQRLVGAHRRAHRRAAATEARAHRVHRVRLPVARALPARQSRGPRVAAGPRPALLGRRPPAGLTARRPATCRRVAAEALVGPIALLRRPRRGVDPEVLVGPVDLGSSRAAGSRPRCTARFSVPDPKRSRTSSSAASSAAPPRASIGSSSWIPARTSTRFVTLMPTSVTPRRSMTRHRGGEQHPRGGEQRVRRRGRGRQRVRAGRSRVVVEAQPQDHRASGVIAGAHAPRDAVDEPDERGVE